MKPALAQDSDLRPALVQALPALGLGGSTPEQQAQWLGHLALIAKWNKVYNLTAVRDPQEMLTHHLLDSLAVAEPLRRHLSALPLARAEPRLRPHHQPHFQPDLQSDPQPNPQPDLQSHLQPHLLDVGSGAGLPGVTLAIAFPELQVSCVDAVAKKATFIRQVAAELGLSRLKALHGRVEQLHISKADVITSRAFASLADMVSLTRPHLAEGGVWMAMKGHIPQEEIQALPADVEVFHVEPLQVPGLPAQRCLVWLRPR